MCGHVCQLVAHDVDMEHRTTHQCQTTCNTTLPCGHVCVSLCHEVDREHKALYKCPIRCEGLLVCGHACRIKASKHACSKHARCVEKCGFMLPCGHPCSLICHHLVSDHMECLLCPNKPSGSLPPSNVGDISNKSGGPDFPSADTSRSIKDVSGEFKIAESRSGSLATTVRFGHLCKALGTCKATCQASLSCGHKCLLKCHKEYSHEAKDTCRECSTLVALREDSELHVDQTPCLVSDTLRKESSSLADVPTGGAFIHCCHHVEMFECEEVCKGRLCGHPCGLRKPHHACLDHVAMNAVACRETCGSELPCGRKCSRVCHVGDSTHNFEGGIGKPSPASAEAKGDRCNDGHFDSLLKSRLKKVHTKMGAKDLNDNCGGGSTKIQSKLHQDHPALSACSEIVQSCRKPLDKGEDDSVKVPRQTPQSAKDVGVLPHKNHKVGGVCEQVCGLVTAPCGHKYICYKQCHFESNPKDHIQCRESSNVLLSCGHKGTLRCSMHKKRYHHDSNERCKICSLTDIIKQKSDSSPTNLCFHLVEGYACKKRCLGRPCGHKCSLSKVQPHKCSEHSASNEIRCLEPCSIKLSCGHACTKPCHVDDYVHDCSSKKVKNCVNSQQSADLKYRGCANGDDFKRHRHSPCCEEQVQEPCPFQKSHDLP